MGGKHFISAIKTWQLLLVFFLLCFVSATLLRFDHIKMAELRDAVLMADEQGDSAQLAENLNKLRNFTFSHIVINVVEENGLNKLEFGTGVFYLEQSYIRDASSALDAAAELEIDDSNPNGNIYALASAVCRPRAIASGWSWNSSEYISCFSEELAKYPADSNSNGSISVALPSPELYRREFSSPIWVFSASGVAILLTIIIGVVIFIRFFIWLILEITLSITKKL